MNRLSLIAVGVALCVSPTPLLAQSTSIQVSAVVLPSAQIVQVSLPEVIGEEGGYMVLEAEVEVRANTGHRIFVRWGHREYIKYPDAEVASLRGEWREIGDQEVEVIHSESASPEEPYRVRFRVPRQSLAEFHALSKFLYYSASTHNPWAY